ncbi:MAG: FeoA family protein [Gemmataceae bacterium]
MIQAMNIPLDLLQTGEWAEVTEVTGSPCLVSRLSELGVMNGCKLCMLQPGKTCLLQVGGSKISLGCALSDCSIFVRPVEA